MGSLGWADRSGGYSSGFGLDSLKITPFLIGGTLLMWALVAEGNHHQPTVSCTTAAKSEDTFEGYATSAHLE